MPVFVQLLGARRFFYVLLFFFYLLCRNNSSTLIRQEEQLNRRLPHVFGSGPNCLIENAWLINSHYNLKGSGSLSVFTSFHSARLH